MLREGLSSLQNSGDLIQSIVYLISLDDILYMFCLCVCVCVVRDVCVCVFLWRAHEKYTY